MKKFGNCSRVRRNEYTHEQLPLRLFTLFVALLLAAAAAAPDSFRFVIIGDRTGEAQPGIYEQVWKDTAAENPAFIISVGDTIQGLNDATADSEWRQAEQNRAP